MQVKNLVQGRTHGKVLNKWWLVSDSHYPPPAGPVNARPQAISRDQDTVFPSLPLLLEEKAG